MFSENHAPANGEHGNATAPGGILVFPDTVARADLPIIAPQAVSGFDQAHARMHIALLLDVPLAGAELCSMIFGGLDDNKERRSPKLTGYTLTSLADIRQNLPFLMRRKDGGNFLERGITGPAKQGCGPLHHGQ